MNYLAHIFLAGNDVDVIIGNFIGDHIKGNRVEEYPLKVQLGIKMHRMIDTYTDSHEIVAMSKARARVVHGHYAPVVIDMYYDHFLARLWERYDQRPLSRFTSSFYQLASESLYLIPLRARKMLRYMSSQDWLYHYQSVEGIGQALTGLSRRATFDSKMELAAHTLSAGYTDYEREFCHFFPDLQMACDEFLEEHDLK